MDRLRWWMCQFSSLYIFMALFGVYALLMIFLLTRDSQTGANAYGPNPKGIGNADVFS